MQQEREEIDKRIYTYRPEIDNRSKLIVKSTLAETTVFDRLGYKPSKKFLIKRERSMA